MQHIKSIKTTALIEGLVKNVVVTIEIDHEDFSPYHNDKNGKRVSYWEQSDIDQTNADLARGAVRCVWVNVRASFSDLAHFEGSDSLGQVFVRGSSDSAIKDVLIDVKAHDMVQCAIDDLIRHVLQGKSRIDTFLTKAA